MLRRVIEEEFVFDMFLFAYDTEGLLEYARSRKAKLNALKRLKKEVEEHNNTHFF